MSTSKTNQQQQKKNPLNLLSQFRDFHNSKDISKKLEKSKDHVYY